MPFLYEEMRARVEQQASDIRFDSSLFFLSSVVAQPMTCAIKFKPKDKHQLKYADLVALKLHGEVLTITSNGLDGEQPPLIGVIVDCGEFLKVLVSLKHISLFEIASKWHMKAIDSVVTATRQYLVLKHIEESNNQVPLKPFLLNPTENKPVIEKEWNRYNGCFAYSFEGLYQKRFFNQ